MTGFCFFPKPVSTWIWEYHLHLFLNSKEITASKICLSGISVKEKKAHKEFKGRGSLILTDWCCTYIQQSSDTKKVCLQMSVPSRTVL